MKRFFYTHVFNGTIMRHYTNININILIKLRQFKIVNVVQKIYYKIQSFKYFKSPIKIIIFYIKSVCD